MSSSVFKEYPSDRNEEGVATKFDSNLVVFINKNGSVSVDHSALQDLLVNDATATNTSVSVIRVGTPSPTLELELNEQAELAKELAKASLHSDNESELENTDEESEDPNDDLNEDDEDVRPSRKLKKSGNAASDQEQRIPNVSLMVENYFNPAEAKQLASEILSLAGITNPLQMSVDFEFMRYVIGNDHCYSLHQRNPSNDLDDQSPTTRNPIETLNISTPLTKGQRRKASHLPLEQSIEVSDYDEDETEQNTDEDEEFTDSDQSYVSPSESDRDSDLDFSVNDRNSKGRKTTNKSRPPTKIQTSKRTVVPKKSHSYTGDPLQSPNPDDQTKKKAKSSKKSNRSVEPLDSTPHSVQTGSNAPATGGQIDFKLKNQEPKTIQLAGNAKLMNKNAPIKITKSVPTTPVIDGQKNNIQLVKNIRKTNAPAETALFSDMKTLFSTPDIIKKVPGSGSTETSTNNRITNISVINLPPVTLTPIPLTNANPANSNIGKKLFMPIALGGQQNRPVLIQGTNTSIRTPNLNTSQQNIVFTNLIQRQPSTHKASSVINNTRTVFNVIGKQTSGIQLIGQPGVSSTNNISSILPITTNPHTMSYPNTNITNDTPVLTDADLLQELGHVEDTLSDDLMQHVAKLVEDKNLQEVIDQQVLGVDSLKALNNSVSNPVKMQTTPTATPTTKAKSKKTPSTASTTLTSTSITPITPAKPTPEPIKIVRSDGRVITLPPIEAPTTRGAKRRAQNQNDSATSSPVSVASQPVKMDTSTPKPDSRRSSVSSERMPSVARKSLNTKTAAASASIAQNQSVEVIEVYDDLEEDGSDGSYNSEDDPYRIWCICRQPHNNRFMICCDKCEEWFHGKCVNVTKAMGVELEERGVEWVCPNCIKKHPHLQQRQLAVLSKKVPSRKASNASLVQELSATASILDTSLQSCIVCKKAARQNSIYCSDECIRLHAQKTKSTSNPASLQQSNHPRQSTKNTAATSTIKTTKNTANTPTIPSKLPAHTTSTPNSQKTTNNTKQINIKTTNELQTTIGNPKSPTPLTPLTAKMTSSTKKNNYVDVFEPSTGRCLTGSSAPTTENLKRWLADHPTFEVVQPGSAHSAAFKAKKQQLQQLAKTMAEEEHKKLFSVSPQTKKVQTTLKVDPNKKVLILNTQPQSTVQTNSPQHKSVVTIPRTQQTISSPTLSAGSPKQTQPSGSKSATTSKSSPAPSVKRKSDVAKSSPTPASSNTTKSTTEPIRVNVQRTLKEQLTLRMDEQTDADFPKLTDDEIDSFVKDTENEIYTLFNKDTGVKYRAKYRSLMFNIKDRKNTSLFAKICEKNITPQQLVRMSAEELASQELAKWRENENKHNLEMIKQSELDLLACAKTYVLKTHKGEEVIEGSSADRVSLDPMVSMEDVVSVLNNTSVTSTSDNIEEKQSQVKDNRIDSRFEKYHSGDTSVGSNKTLSSDTKLSSSPGHGSSKRSRSPGKDRSHSDKHKSSKSKHRKRSRDHRSPSDSDRPKDKTKHESSSAEPASGKKEHRSKDRHKSSDKSSDKDRTKKRSDEEAQRSYDKKKDDHKKRHSDTRESTKNIKPVAQNCNIIDEILKAQMNSIIKSDDFVPKETPPVNAAVVPPVVAPVRKPTEIEQEPISTTLTIPTPPESHYQHNDSPMELDRDDSPASDTTIWSGSLFMVDVATLCVSLAPITGESTGVAYEIPEELNVVGRISPDIVWDYITKIRKSVNKDVLVIRFESSVDTSDNIDAYKHLYHYLMERKRFGVIKVKSSYIKDFYLLPLAAHKSMPSILPKPGKEFDVNRKDMLIGLIVLNINVKGTLSLKKRPTTAPIKTSNPKVPRTSESRKTPVPALVEKARYTPPLSPKAFAAPTLESKVTANPIVMDDGDEPYSPGGSDDDDSIMPYANLNIPTTAPVNPLIQSLMSSGSNSRDQPSPSAPLDKVDIQRKMEELTRQIAAQKMEIAGMLHDDPRVAVQLDEPYSPTSMLGVDKSSTDNLSGIAIPANLQEILNSIKGSTKNSIPYENEEYDPTAVVPSASALSYQSLNVGYNPVAKNSAPSKLAQLTDEELLSMVPDDARDHLVMPKKTSTSDLSAGPAPPGTLRSIYNLQSALQPPGVDEEYVP